MIFTGKVIVLAGAAEGIGHALARRFAEAGACLVLAGIKEGPSVLQPCGSIAPFIPADIGSPHGMAALVAKVVAEHGRIDLLLADAGLSAPVDADALSPEQAAEKIVERIVRDGLCIAGSVRPHRPTELLGYVILPAEAPALSAQAAA